MLTKDRVAPARGVIIAVIISVLLVAALWYFPFPTTVTLILLFAAVFIHA